MFNSNVAPKRRIRQARGPWRCRCGIWVEKYFTRCTECSAPRPN